MRGCLAIALGLLCGAVAYGGDGAPATKPASDLRQQQEAKYDLGMDKAVRGREDAVRAAGRGVFESYLKQWPDGPQARRVRYYLVYSHIQEKGGVDAGLLALRKLQKQYPDADYAEALLLVADEYRGKTRLDDAFTIASEVIKSYPDHVEAAQAYITQALVYEQRKQEAQMVKAFENALAMNPRKIDTPGTDRRPKVSRQIANERLGRHYMSKRDYAKALDYLAAVVPAGWCGTGNAGVRKERDKDILECLQHVDDTAKKRAALEKVVFGVDARGWAITRALIDNYAATNQLPLLEAKVRKSPWKISDINLLVHRALHDDLIVYFNIKSAVGKKDCQALWRELGGKPIWETPCDDEYENDPLGPMAIDGLASFKGDAVGFLEGKLKSTSSWDQHMALLVLAKIQPDQTFKRLQEHVATEKAWRDLLDDYYTMGQIGTPEAMAFLHKQADHAQGQQQQAAKRVLEDLDRSHAATQPASKPATKPAKR